jgi:hypothetical protein
VRRSCSPALPDSRREKEKGLVRSRQAPWSKALEGDVTFWGAQSRLCRLLQCGT